MFEITDKDQELTSSFLGVGIHENVTMERPTFTSLTEGKDPVLQLIFTSPGGGHSETIWNVDPAHERENIVKYPRIHTRDNRVKGYIKGEEVTPDEAVEMAYAEFRAKMKHVATKFMDDATLEEGLKGATSYELFAQKYIALFTDERLAAGNPVRLKLPPKSNGYAAIPRFGAFMEPMSISKESSKLSFSDYEKRLINDLNSSAASDPDTFDMEGSSSVPGPDFAPATFDEDGPGF